MFHHLGNILRCVALTLTLVVGSAGVCLAQADTGARGGATDRPSEPARADSGFNFGWLGLLGLAGLAGLFRRSDAAPRHESAMGGASARP